MVTLHLRIIKKTQCLRPPITQSSEAWDSRNKCANLKPSNLPNSEQFAVIKAAQPFCKTFIQQPFKKHAQIPSTAPQLIGTNNINVLFVYKSIVVIAEKNQKTSAIYWQRSCFRLKSIRRKISVCRHPRYVNRIRTIRSSPFIYICRICKFGHVNIKVTNNSNIFICEKCSKS